MEQDLTPSAGPEIFRDAQKQWTDQLESMAKLFAKAMSTEEFAKMLGQYMEQPLYWQERMSKATSPQVDATLRSMNLPSRAQIDRLFERIIGLEERLDDLEDQNRLIIKNTSANRRVRSGA